MKIDAYILEDIQERIMEIMTDLYLNGERDELAQHIAHTLVHAYDDISLELTERDFYAANA